MACKMNRRNFLRRCATLIGAIAASPLLKFIPVVGNGKEGCAQVATWNVALSDEEIAALAMGCSPLFIRPENLIRFMEQR